MRIENLPYASLANTKYTCCSDKTLIIRDSKNSPARTCHRLPVLQITGRTGPNNCQYELEMIPSCLTSFSGQDMSGLQGKQLSDISEVLPSVAEFENVDI